MRVNPLIDKEKIRAQRKKPAFCPPKIKGWKVLMVFLGKDSPMKKDIPRKHGWSYLDKNRVGEASGWHEPVFPGWYPTMFGRSYDSGFSPRIARKEMRNYWYAIYVKK